MLRESCQRSAQDVALADLTRGMSGDTRIPHGAILMRYAEAVVSEDSSSIARARHAVYTSMGHHATVDAAATIAAFHGFVRIADSIGIPYTTAAFGHDAPDIRDAVGISEFPRVRADAS